MVVCGIGDRDGDGCGYMIIMYGFHKYHIAGNFRGMLIFVIFVTIP